jgi:hypothetical protein
MSSLRRHTSIALLLGLSGLAMGLGLILLPLFAPSLPFWLWGTCYWCGGALMILGGLAADVTLLYFILIILRRLHGSRSAARG